MNTVYCTNNLLQTERVQVWNTFLLIGSDQISSTQIIDNCLVPDLVFGANRERISSRMLRSSEEETSTDVTGFRRLRRPSSSRIC
ncbi:hypothetical protein J6590_079933 [Homalodisca vitripennis]|nr:hypothetical protein J6590_079933 [Homalodisca vitripennis]